jgi:cell division septal protein FtsQ
LITDFYRSLMIYSHPLSVAIRLISFFYLWSMWNKKKRRTELNLRAPQKRKSFFEKKEETPENPLFLRILFRMLLVLFVGAVGYALFFSPFLEIRSISLDGISELPYDSVHQTVQEVIGEKYLKIIPQNNLILLSSDKVRTALLEHFKKINAVSIKKIFPDTLKVTITERKALLVWCSGDSCFIIDENGSAYSEADFDSEEIKQNNLVRLNDASAKPVAVGDKVLTPGYIQYVTALGGALDKDAGITISGDYQTESRVAEEVKVTSAEGWQIFFSTSLPMADSISALKTFLDKEIDQSKRGGLEYVDLRAENKVYYKMRTDADPTQTNADVHQADTEKTQPSAETKKDTKKKK